MTMSAIVGVLLVLQAMTALGDNLSPLLPPAIADNICKGVECGKGTCKSSGSSNFLFECDCDEGWKQTRSDDDHDDKLAFLPCVIPNCTIDYTCKEAGPPVPNEKPSNKSILDPCYWTDCGGGTCKTASTLFAHTCECNEGFGNLFNISSFPCLKQCAIGGDCSSLGIEMSNKSSTSTTNLADKGSSIPQGRISWVVVSMMFFVPFLCK